MEDVEIRALLQRLIAIVTDIASISNFKFVFKRDCCDLLRRLKFLGVLFEELKEIDEPIRRDSVRGLVSLKEALRLARWLLVVCSQGCSVFLVLRRKKIINKFQEVAVDFERALHDVAYQTFGIPSEVKEQVGLIHAQFGRAKERISAPDSELYEDLLSIYNQKSDVQTDPAVLRTLCEKLQLTGVEDLKQESLGLHETFVSSGEAPTESIEKMSILLKRFQNFLEVEKPDAIFPAVDPSSRSGQASTQKYYKSPVIPDDFRCPISLELMKDPVIISTGQTYERACIRKWLDAGHGTCPKTRQVLRSNTVIPNYIVRNLISQWCETNGIQPSKKSGHLCSVKTDSACLLKVEEINTLLSKLASENIEDQRSAAGEVRLFARENNENRILIGESGAIPLLTTLLFESDASTQEQAVTALLNLSISDYNKRIIVSSDSLPGILNVLKKGTMEARENSAATLFSLSAIDEYKFRIGASGAIPPLITLLTQGTQRGKLDSASALFNICLYQGNVGRAVGAGIVPVLMNMVQEPSGGMVDVALAIMSMVASHADASFEIGALKGVPVLVEIVRNGSPKSRENATAVLVHVCGGDRHLLVEACELGVRADVLGLAENGSHRGRHKAALLLQLIDGVDVAASS